MSAKANVMPDPVIGAATTRVSLELQIGNYSTDAQKTRVLDLAAQHGVTIPDEFLFDDGGYSGTSFDRPSIAKILKLVHDGKIQAVVFPEVDRFSRNVEAGLAMVRQLREAGARVIIGVIGEVKDEANCRLMLMMYLWLAEEQRNAIVSKSKSGVEQMLRDGIPFAPRSPYGYKKPTKLELMNDAIKRGVEPPTGKNRSGFERVEEQIENIRLMGKLATVEGLSARAIAREMTARGIKTPKGGKAWNPSSVIGMLSNELYSTGIWHYGKTDHRAPVSRRRGSKAAEKNLKSSHKLRSRSEWKPVTLPGEPVFAAGEQAAILEALGKNGRITNGKPVTTGDEAVLKSLVICRLCKKAVVRYGTTRPNERRENRYRCSNRNRSSVEHDCPARFIRTSVLEDAIWDAWRRAFGPELRARVAEYFDELKQSTDDEDVAALEAARDGKVRERNDARARELKAEDEDDRSFYARRMVELKAEIALLDRRIQAAAAEVPVVDYDEIVREVEAVSNSTDPATRRGVLLDFVERIEWEGAEADMFVRFLSQTVNITFVFFTFADEVARGVEADFGRVAG
jgi:DNA invertase Pin-like site-specific DNA recombinase